MRTPQMQCWTENEEANVHANKHFIDTIAAAEGDMV